MAKVIHFGAQSLKQNLRRGMGLRQAADAIFSQVALKHNTIGLSTDKVDLGQAREAFVQALLHAPEHRDIEKAYRSLQTLLMQQRSGLKS